MNSARDIGTSTFLRVYYEDRFEQIICRSNPGSKVSHFKRKEYRRTYRVPGNYTRMIAEIFLSDFIR